ncbi:Ig-like domain-containing protein [Flavobacterium nitrogenifigens]|uniref:PA14 domain-containing protein n=1 Tax=Flavobacterium nitrogenifigens TaxID=1617283 RepID=A0A521D022_9FLAO|nr:Ig-like domain-containing protein [Flavobacterium nitrogenifigens]KAF2332043.1 T9SS sorting signal type C domain-containing protein [Flavobacterium nitrogenifigens]SMO65043.1 PA14 domain-containing protein [Flavobacterium nitrogenifigens]
MKKTLLLFLLLPFFGFAQTDLVKWDATNSGNRFAPVPIGTINASDLSATVTNIYNSTNAANTFFESSGWPTSTSKGGQYDPTKYLQFVLWPKTGNKVNLNTFSFECKSPGSQKYTIKYSKQSDFSSGVFNLLTATAVTSNWIQYTLNFSEEINPVLPTEKVYVRIYAYYTNNEFQIRTGSGNIVPTINGEVLSFDSTKILAINDYVTTTKDVAVNINPLSNDVNKANVNTLVISIPPSAAEGTAIINPDKTITFNPASGFIGTSVFNYTISNATETSTGTIKVTVNQDTTDFLSLWNGADDTFNPVTKQYVDPNSPITKAGTNISLDYTFQNQNNAFFQTSGWPASPSNPNVVDKADETKYIQFKIAPDSKHKLNLKQFNFTYRGKNQKFLVKYSKNPDFTSGAQILIPDSNTPSSWTSLTNNIAPGLNTLLPGETLYIRFYVYANNTPNSSFDIKNGNGSPEGPVITGTIDDVFTLTAKNDFISTPSNQAVTVPILDNDVIGGYPLESITVTQPSNGTVTVNGLNNITFTPAANFTGSATFTYTLKNTNSNYSSATVTVNATAPVCNPGDQIKYGDNKWIGYVYKSTTLPPSADPNPATPTTIPISNMTYIGQVEENKLFNRDVIQGTVTGVNPQLCESPSDYFFVRYKMKTKVDVTGTYNITVGGDDYYRLYLTTASGTTKIIDQWSGVNYSQKAINMELTAGVEYTFDLEYYEKTTDSRIQFSMGLIAGSNTVPYPFGDNLWKVYGFTTADNGNNFTIPQGSYAGYYSVNPVNINTTDSFALAESPSFNPAASGWQGAPVPQDYFTLVYKRQGFPCGTYQIQITNCDDQVQIFIDDENATSPVYTSPGNINDNAPANNILTTPRVLGKNSKVEIRLKDYKLSARLNLNFIKIITTYNGTGTIPNGSSVVINANTELNSDLAVCSCTINDGVTLTVKKDVTLTVDENINVFGQGKLLILDGGSLLQTSTSKDMFTGSSQAFEAQRTINVARYDVTFWSVPVNNTSYTMNSLSPQTLYDKYYTWNASLGKWEVSPNGILPMEPGKGYSIRAPQTYDINIPADFTAKFTGTPNNGDIPVPLVADKWNLVGNPYPSSIDAEEFITQNGDVGALYFWSHNTPPKLIEGTTTYRYSGSDYAVFSLMGETRPSPKGTVPSGYIGTGQGFFIQPKVSSIVFSNSQRVNAQNTSFFKATSKTNKIEKNRLWLNLSNNDYAFKQMLIGYATGATNSIDPNFDAITLASNSYIDFFSINETKKLTIQGRALPFDDADIVQLGYKSTFVGDLTISIDHADGFFTTQPVYLEDKVTGTITDLRKENYTFSSGTGTYSNRFVLRYTNKTLNTDDFENVKDGILVAVKSKVINVTSGVENIKEVQIYTIGGQLLYSKNKIEAKELEVANLHSSNQVLLVKTILENDHAVTRKILFN